MPDPSLDFAQYLSQQPVASPETDIAMGTSGGAPVLPQSRETAPATYNPGGMTMGPGVGPTDLEQQMQQQKADLAAARASATTGRAADQLVNSMGGPAQAQQGVPPMLAKPAPDTTPAPPPKLAPAPAQRGTGGSGGASTGGGGESGFAPMAQAFREQKDAVQAAADVEKARLVGQAEVDQHAQDIAVAQEARQVRMQQDYQKSYDAQMQALQATQDKFDKINTVVDPGRYTGNMSTPAKILAIVGAAAGGYGGNNAGLDNLRQAINADIDAQKATIQGNLAKGEKALNTRVTQLSVLRDKFHDDDQADAALRVMQWNTAGKQTEVLMGKYKSPEVQAKLKATMAGIDTQRAEAMQKFADTAHAKAIENMKLSIEMHRAQTEDAKTAAEILKEQQGKTAKPSAAMDGALQLLNDLDGTFKKANSGVGGSVSSALGVGKGGEYADKVDSYAPVIAKAVYGSSRAATPEMVKAVKEMLPGLIKRGAKAHEMIQSLRNTLAANASTPAGASDASGLDLREE